jgi:hypothetical protein
MNPIKTILAEIIRVYSKWLILMYSLCTLLLLTTPPKVLLELVLLPLLGLLVLCLHEIGHFIAIPKECRDRSLRFEVTRYAFKLIIERNCMSSKHIAYAVLYSLALSLLLIIVLYIANMFIAASVMSLLILILTCGDLLTLLK